MRPDRDMLSVQQKHSPEKKRELADQLAAAVADLGSITAEKKVADAAFNGRIKAKEDEVSELARSYNKNYEMVDVECKIRYDTPERGKKSYYSIAGEEMIETREMTRDDWQLPLPVSPLNNATTVPPPAEEMPTVPKEPEVSYRSIADLAAVLFNLPDDEKKSAIDEWAEKLAPQIFSQGKIDDRNGRSKKITSMEAARGIALQWLTGCMVLEKKDDAQAD